MPTGERWWAEDTKEWSNWVDWVSKPTWADYLRHLRAIPIWLARLGFEPPSNAHDYSAEMVMAISWDRERSAPLAESARRAEILPRMEGRTARGEPPVVARGDGPRHHAGSAPVSVGLRCRRSSS